MKLKSLRKLMALTLATAMVFSLLPSNSSYAAESVSDSIEASQITGDETQDESVREESEKKEEKTEAETEEEKSEEASEEKTEEVTEAQTEEATEEVTEAVTEETTEETTEAVTEETTEEITEDKTEVNTEETTESVTEAQDEETDEEVDEEDADEEDGKEKKTKKKKKKEQKLVPTFDHPYDGVSVAGLDFSSCELLIAVADSSVFTADTEVVSEYKGIYLTRYKNAEQTKNAYTYYYKKAIYIDVNSSVRATSLNVRSYKTKKADKKDKSSDEDSEEDAEEDEEPEQFEADEAEMEEVKEELPNDGHGEADLSDLNEGDDALSNINGVAVANYSGCIALIDTGASASNIVGSVSVLGGGAGDDNGHGTRMAEAIAEANPNAGVLSIKALDSSAVGSVSDVYAAIQYAIAARVSIINLSMASVVNADSDILSKAIAEAQASGIRVVAAAGNSSAPASYFIPAGLSGVITVGACDKDGERIASSNYGGSVDFYVTADSTSVASAKLAGYLLSDGYDKVTERKDVFTREYVEDEDHSAKETEKDEKEDVKEEETSTTTDATQPDATNTDAEEDKDDEKEKEHKHYKNNQELLDDILLYGAATPPDGSGFPHYINNVTVVINQTSAAGKTFSGTMVSANVPSSSRYYNKIKTGDVWCECARLNENCADPGPGRHTISNVRFEYTSSSGNTATYTCISNVDGQSHGSGYQRMGLTIKLDKQNSFISIQKLLAGNPKNNLKDVYFDVYDNASGSGTPLGYMKTSSSSGFAHNVYEDKDISTLTHATSDGLAGSLDLPPGTTVYLFEVGQGSSYNDAKNNVPKDSKYKTDAAHDAGQPNVTKYAIDLLPNDPNHIARYTVITTATKGAAEETLSNPVEEFVPLYKVDEYGNELTARYDIYGTTENVDLTNSTDRTTLINRIKNAAGSKLVTTLTVVDGFGVADVSSYKRDHLNDTRHYYAIEQEGQHLHTHITSLPFKVESRTYKPSKGEYGYNLNIDLESHYYYKVGIYKHDPSGKTVQATFDIYATTTKNGTSGGTKIATVTTNGATGYGVVDVTKDYIDSVKINKEHYYYATETAVVSPYVNTRQTKSLKMSMGTTPDFVLAHVDHVDWVNNSVIEVQINKTINSTYRADILKNPNYSLTGTEFTLYKDANCTQAVPGKITLTQNADGSISSSKLNVTESMRDGSGNIVQTRFYYKETKPGKNYNTLVYDSSSHYVDVKPTDSLKLINVPNTPKFDLINMTLEKVSDVDDDYDLSGAVFEVSFYPQNIDARFAGGTPSDTWYFVSKKEGDKYVLRTTKSYLDTTRTSSTRYFNSSNVLETPIGYITVKEIVAPTGFTLNGPISAKATDGSTVVANNGTLVIKAYNGLQAETSTGYKAIDGSEVKKDEESIRADIDLYKVNEDGEPMEGVKFKVTNLRTNQSVILVTDEKGYVSTASSYVLHSVNTNAGVAKCGTWFGNIAKLNDAKGALSHDDYTIKELRSEANKDVNLELPVTVSKDDIENNNGKTITIYDKNAKSPEGKIWNYVKPKIKTTASVKETGLKTLGQADADQNFDYTNQTIEDKVEYTNLKTSTNYILLTKLMVVDADGNITPYTRNGNEYKQITQFTTTDEYEKSRYELSSSETVEILGVDPTGFDENNNHFVVFQYLYLDDGYTSVDDLENAIANNTILTRYPEYDKDDDMDFFPIVHEEDVLEQTVYPGIIHTTAKDIVTDDHISYPQSTTITDRVYYRGLDYTKGEEYTIEGELHVKPGTQWSVKKYDPTNPAADAEGYVYDTEDNTESTGEYVLKDSNGNPITATKTFVPTSSEGYVVLEFTVDASLIEGRSVVAFEKLKHLDQTLLIHADINDEDETIHFGSFKTTARNSKAPEGKTDESAKEVPAVKDGSSITDTIHAHNILANRKYIAKAVLMDKASGEILKDATGKEIRAEKEFSTKDVAAVNVTTSPNGNDTADLDLSADHADYSCDMDIDVVFEGYDLSNLANKVGVAFEEIYLISGGKNILIGEHKDIDDVDQFVSFIEVHTNATDSTTKIKVVPQDAPTVLEDLLTFKNVIPGKTYKVTATIHVKNDKSGTYKDGDVLKGPDGKPVTVDYEFTPTTKDGTQIVKIPLNTTGLRNMDIVVFEDLYNEYGLLVASHSDIEDKLQTLRVPDGHTTAKDKDTGIQTSRLDKTVTIVDTFFYENLEPSKTYSVELVLMDKNTGKELLINGQKVTKTIEFTPDKPTGSVDVEVTIDATALNGQSIVCFETVKYNNIPVIIHADINDQAEEIYFPDGHTTATDSETEDHISPAAKSVTVVDRFFYEGLTPNVEYELSGIIYSKKTNKPIKAGGKEITKTIKFTPDKSSGYVDVEFKFSSEALEGATLVVFEDLYYTNPDTGIKVKLIEHHDIDDTDQSIQIARIGTKATFENAKKNIVANGEVTIVDEVSYKNLTPGKYRLEGTLKYSDTGKDVIVDGKPVTAEVTFTAKEPDGTVKVKFKFNASGISGDIVVFETLFYADTDIELCNHRDIDDSAQTVTITPPATIPPKTGMAIFFAILGLMIAGGAGMIIFRKKDDTVPEES